MTLVGAPVRGTLAALFPRFQFRLDSSALRPSLFSFRPPPSSSILDEMQKVVRLSPELAAEAVAHIGAADPIMRRLIAGVGPFGLKARRNRFHTLVRAIVSQQISTSAARSILARLEAALEPVGMTPEALARLSSTKMRRAGVSPQKVGYLKDLAERVASGQVRLDR